MTKIMLLLTINIWNGCVGYYEYIVLDIKNRLYNINSLFSECLN